MLIYDLTVCCWFLIIVYSVIIRPFKKKKVGYPIVGFLLLFIQLYVPLKKKETTEAVSMETTMVFRFLFVFWLEKEGVFQQ